MFVTEGAREPLAASKGRTQNPRKTCSSLVSVRDTMKVLVVDEDASAIARGHVSGEGAVAERGIGGRCCDYSPAGICVIAFEGTVRAG